MRKIALICILTFMTLSLALAQVDQNLTVSKITNPTNTLSKLGLKSTYDIESYGNIKPIYNMGMPTLLGKPVFDVSQRVGQPAKFAYNIGMIKPAFNVSQRAGKLTIINYTTGWIKPAYEVSAYSRIKPMYNINQFTEIKPIYQVS